MYVFSEDSRKKRINNSFNEKDEKNKSFYVHFTKCLQFEKIGFPIFRSREVSIYSSLFATILSILFQFVIFNVDKKKVLIVS